LSPYKSINSANLHPVQSSRGQAAHILSGSALLSLLFAAFSTTPIKASYLATVSVALYLPFLSADAVGLDTPSTLEISFNVSIAWYTNQPIHSVCEVIFMPTIKRDWPDIETDLKIIANRRAAIIRDSGIIGAVDSAEEFKFFDIPSFTCNTRIYISNRGAVLAILPFDAFDEITLITEVLLTHIENPPLEVWILKDDQVIQFWEEPESVLDS